MLFDLKNFIAEVGVNHENSLENAKKMIKECADLGIGSVKFQSYNATKLAAKESPAYWDLTKEKTASQIELFSKYDKFGINEFRTLAEYCNKCGIEFLTTPFDLDYVDAIDAYVKRYKVASVDCTNYILLEKIASKRKPIIMSVGATTEEEIEDSVSFLKKLGVQKLTLLHCIVNYPTSYNMASLKFIRQLKNKFPELQIGYSDHTVPEESQTVLLAAIAMGADYIEKHYTFDKSLPGNDHYHAFDHSDLQLFQKNVKIWNESQPVKSLETQKNTIQYARRGLYASKDISAGELITRSNIIPLRPLMNYLPANSLEILNGRHSKKTIKKGDGIREEDLN